MYILMLGSIASDLYMIGVSIAFCSHVIPMIVSPFYDDFSFSNIDVHRFAYDIRIWTEIYKYVKILNTCIISYAFKLPH